MKFIDLTGQRFGRLVVNKIMSKDKNNKIMWLCGCDCGKETVVRGSDLKNGKVRSCGCLHDEGNRLKHGHSGTKTYKAWYDMKRRCNNKRHRHYKDYGGRGITVCPRWSDKINGYQNFLKDIGEIPEGKELDRIDNNKLINGYSPENCKLSSRKEQTRNTRKNIKYNFNNKIQCVSALAEDNNIHKSTLTHRLNKLKMSIEEALTKPIRKHKKYKQKRK